MDTPHAPAKASKRKHSAGFKRKLVGLTQQAGASVAAIALEHGVNANLVFKWRREQLGLSSMAKPARSAVLLPVTVDPLPPASATGNSVPAVANNARASCGGVIEIEFGGARVRLRGVVDEDSLRCVLLALKDAA